MFDNQLFQLVIPLLTNGMAALGYANFPVQQAYQPTQQGVNTGPTFYIQKLPGDNPVGYPYKPDTPGEIGHADFTASIATNVLTVTGVNSGRLGVGQAILGDDVPLNMYILQQLSGTSGGIGTYKLNGAAAIDEEEMTAVPEQMVHIEIQQYETSFQLSCLARQDPADADAITASDYLNLARYIIQSAPTIQTLQNAGVGVYKITPVRNPFFHDDRDQWEANPNFDFVLTHKQSIVSQTPILQSETFEIYRI